MTVPVAGAGIERTASTHPIPSDMDASIFANGELSAANGAHGHGSVTLHVDGHGFGKFLLAGFAADVENVAAFGVAFEVDQVDDALGIQGGLGLDAVIWRGDEFDML